jgi:PAS domain S-box-containing protein
MKLLQDFLASSSDENRARAYLYASVLLVLIAFTDWKLVPDLSIGAFYIVPIMFVSPTLGKPWILLLSGLCGTLWELCHPFHHAPGADARILVGFGGFALMGVFVSELNRNRRQITEHSLEREHYFQLRLDAERQIRVLIDTSPLAILTVNQEGNILLHNNSLRKLLGTETELQGADARVFLPILARLLKGQDGNLRTTVECPGRRQDGEVFLAQLWVSTYPTVAGIELAAVIWDASENLRDREDAGLDSMLATSRTLIGALSHEVRNLTSAALLSYEGLAADREIEKSERYQALGTIIKGLQKIASNGLRLASQRTADVADLDTVLDAARIVIEPILRDAGGLVRWQIAGDLPRVQADQHSLLQVFLNLARNSRRAVEEAACKEFSVEAGLERDLVVIRFRDSGPGVADPSQLFLPFQPGAQSEGLGLYISRAILRSHGGDLRYEPQSVGACFVVELWPAEFIAGEHGQDTGAVD